MINQTPTEYFWISETCVMRAFKRCISDELHGEKTVDWIQCPSCQSWYHGVCVGLAVSTLPADVVSQFSCCCSRFSKAPMLVWSYTSNIIIRNFCCACSVAQDRSYLLTMSDLRSIYTITMVYQMPLLIFLSGTCIHLQTVLYTHVTVCIFLFTLEQFFQSGLMAR